MTKRDDLYFNKVTGDIVTATKSQAKKLPEDYAKLEFLKNDKGVPVMRFRFNGATVDVSENNDQEAVSDGNGNAE